MRLSVAPGSRRVGLERGLDGGRNELRGLRVDDDVPAEQHAADHLPGVPGRIARADGGGGGEGPVASGSVTPGLQKTAPAGLMDTPALHTSFNALRAVIEVPAGRS